MTNQHTPITVEEGNRLIAEFMGATTLPYLPFNVSDMKYHELWDKWLMPVVEKISKQTKVEMIFTANKFICATPNIQDGLDKTTDNNNMNIKAVWLACIEFIKLYNTQTPQP